MTLTKRPPIRSKKLRQAASGQRCTMNLPGICNYDPETTVFAHFRDETFGRGIKADDTSGAHLCSACHTALDTCSTGEAEGEVYKLMLRAMQRTIRRLVFMGVMVIPQDPKPKQKSIKRKPKEQRKAIPSRPFGGYVSNAIDIREDRT
jgi:hypothetical protein